MSSSDTITISSTAMTSTTGSYYTLSGGGGSSGTISIGGLSGTSGGAGYNPCIVNIGAGTSSPCYTTSTTSFGSINIFGEDFVDRMPDLRRIQDMCEQYPALSMAWEKFKTTYRLVKDDYDTPKTSN